MSRLSSNLRPVLPRNDYSSTSLNGMEIPSPSVPAWTEASRRIASYHDAKPLPPTPSLQVPSIHSSRRPSINSSRTNSAASSVYSEDPSSASEHSWNGNRLITSPPQPLVNFPKQRSSISNLPDSLPARPKLTRNAKTQAVLPVQHNLRDGSADSTFRGRRPSMNREPYQEIKMPVPSATPAQELQAGAHVAEQHAADYMSMLPRKSKIIGHEPNTDYVVYNVLSSPTVMSSRVTDVVDDSLVPMPLRFSTSTTDERSSINSNFSFLSSIISTFGEEAEESTGFHAEPEFTAHVFSNNTVLVTDMDSEINDEFFSPEQRSQINSMTPSQRGSLQQAIIKMYHTSSNKYDPSMTFHSPAEIDLSAQVEPIGKLGQGIDASGKSVGDDSISGLTQQKYYRASWKQNDMPSSSTYPESSRGSWPVGSPIGATPKTSQFPGSTHIKSPSMGSRFSFPAVEKNVGKRYSFPRTDHNNTKNSSVGGKLKKVVGLEKKDKDAEDEKRRQDLKKKIKVVETIAHGPFG